MQEQNLAPVIKDVEQFKTGLVVPSVESRDEYAKAGDAVKMVSNKVKELESKRLDMTRPLDQSKKLIMDEFKKLTEPLNRFIEDTKRNMLVWNRKEQERIAEEQRIAREKAAEEERKRIAAVEEARKAAEEAARKKAEDEGIPDGFLDPEPVEETPVAPIEAPKPAPVEDVKTQRGSYATTTVKQDWKYQIVDVSAIPREYMTPDLAKITKAVRSNGVREIPGLRIYDAGNISVR